MAYSLAIGLLLSSVARGAINEQHFAAANIIHKDVAIVGAGASGTYAAIRLREDYNKSVVVIERDDRMGGHVDTYIDPETHEPVDYGVLSYWNYGPAKDFFARLEVDIVSAPQDTSTIVYVDHKTAKNLTSYGPPALPDVLTSIASFGNESKKYDSILLPGYWDFPTGDDIPSDLLLPFGEFAEKYQVVNGFPLIHIAAGLGVGGVRDVPTLYAMGFAFGSPAAKGVMKGDGFAPKSRSNSQLYDQAYALLEKDVLLHSCIVQAERDHLGARLVVRNADGTKTLIKAKQLLVTANPLMSNIESLNLDDQESAVFLMGAPRQLYNGLITTSAIPRNISVHFVSSAVVPDNHLDLYKDLHYALKFESAGPESSRLFRVLLETDYQLTAEEAKTIIHDQFEALLSAGTFDVDGNSHLGYEWKAFTNHNSILWRLPADEIKAGFITNLYALQGHRSTWYTGSLWCTDFSSNVWAYTDTVLERMVG